MSYHSSAAIEAYADVASSSLQNNEHLWQAKKVRPWMAIKETILLVVSLSSPLLMALENNEEIKNERKRTNGGAKKMKNIWKTKGIKEMERERGDEEKRFFRLERLGVWQENKRCRAGAKDPTVAWEIIGDSRAIILLRKRKKKKNTHASLLFCWINFDGDGSGSGDVQLVIVVLNNFIGFCSAFTDKDSFPCPTWIQLSVPRETKKDIYVVVLYFFF